MVARIKRAHRVHHHVTSCAPVIVRLADRSAGENAPLDIAVRSRFEGHRLRTATTVALLVSATLLARIWIDRVLRKLYRSHALDGYPEVVCRVLPPQPPIKGELIAIGGQRHVDGRDETDKAEALLSRL